MTDPSFDSLPEWTEDELLVLRSADDDRPPTRSLPATLAAVGVGSALASGAAAAKGASVATAKWGSVVAISKWVGIVALGGAAVTGGMVLVEHSRQRASAAKALDRAHAPASEIRVFEKPQTSTSPELRVPEPPTPAAAQEAGPVNPSGRKVAAQSQPDISLEISALDEARTALRAGRTADALAALDHYDRAFAKGGSLRVEATALRIEALLRAGNRDRATLLANAFLAHNPKSPYAARVRALVSKNSASE